MMVVTATVLLAALQTDFGVRVPPGTSAPAAPDVTVVRPKQKLGQTPKGAAFSCMVRSVTDGDTFRCTSGTRVRLSSIDAPEMPGSCRPGRNCAPGNPYAAKAALQRLIGGRTVQCEKVGMSYDRVAAWCSANGMDLSCAMVRGGYAVILAQFDRGHRLCR
jgi:endonuclease YncB( thermonuclease family)